MRNKRLHHGLFDMHVNYAKAQEPADVHTTTPIAYIAPT